MTDQITEATLQERLRKQGHRATCCELGAVLHEAAAALDDNQRLIDDLASGAELAAMQDRLDEQQREIERLTAVIAALRDCGNCDVCGHHVASLGGDNA